MTQPFPNWLKLVTLRYQDSDQFTTGLVQLPITYSGPSIPLEWPFTSVASNSLTASPPLSTSSSLSPQVVRFINGGGPFTVLGDVILTASASIHSFPTTSTTMISATPTPSPILTATLVLAQPTANPTPSSSNPGRSPSNLLELGFVVMLITLVVLLLAISIFLVKYHKRRKNHVGKNYDRFMQDNHDDSSLGLDSQDLDGSPLPQNRSSNLCDAIPTLLRQHASLNAEIKEKNMPHLETQFLITPQRSPTNHASRWMRWNKLFTKFQLFRQRNKDRVEVYDQPLPQFISHFSNPYHDPSVNTDTAERVSRWRTKCDSPSPSALRLPSTITSNKNDRKSDYKTPYSSLSEKDHAAKVNYIEIANPTQCAEEDVCFNTPPSIRRPTGKMQDQDSQLLKVSQLTASKRIQRSLKSASPRWDVSKSQSDRTKKSIIPTALYKASTRMTSSFGRTAGRRNAPERYPDQSPPLLIAECEGDASESEETDLGKSSLDFNKDLTRSPSQCERDTPVSCSVGPSGLENSIDSICSPRSPSLPGSSVALVCSAKKVRRKTSSLNASPRPSLSSSPLSSVKLRKDSASKLTPTTGFQILPSLPNTPVILPRKKSEYPALKHSNSVFGKLETRINFAMAPDSTIQHETNVDSHLNEEVSRTDQEKKVRDEDASPTEMVPTSSKAPMKHRTETFDQGLVIAPDRNIKESPGNNLSNIDEVIFSGNSGSRPIGNTGGVSELGNLETKGVYFAGSSSHQTAPRSPPASSGILDGDAYSCKSADLFYVKPQAAHALGRRRTMETATEARSDWEFTRNC